MDDEKRRRKNEYQREWRRRRKIASASINVLGSAQSTLTYMMSMNAAAPDTQISPTVQDGEHDISIFQDLTQDLNRDAHVTCDLDEERARKLDSSHEYKCENRKRKKEEVDNTMKDGCITHGITLSGLSANQAYNSTSLLGVKKCGSRSPFKDITNTIATVSDSTSMIPECGEKPSPFKYMNNTIATGSITTSTRAEGAQKPSPVKDSAELVYINLEEEKRVTKERI